MASSNYRLPVKPLNQVSRIAAGSEYALGLALTSAASAASLITFGVCALVDTNAWILNTTLLGLSVLLAGTVSAGLLVRTKLTARVAFQAGILGAFKKVNPAMQHKALALYNAGLKIMISDFICGGNEAMRDQVNLRVKKIRELGTAHEASQIHALGNTDLHEATQLIDNLARPAIEAAKSDEQKAKEATARAKEDEAAERHRTKVARERERDAVEPTQVLKSYQSPNLSGKSIYDEPEPKPVKYR